jgi:hypothetical protein
LHRQSGIGLVGALFLLAVAGLAVTVLVKLGPHYMEFLTVKSVMEDLAQQPGETSAGVRGVRKALERRLYTNAVTGANVKDFSFRKRPGGHELSVDYKVQEHLLANVDVVLSFSHAVPLTVK